MLSEQSSSEPGASRRTDLDAVVKWKESREKGIRCCLILGSDFCGARAMNETVEERSVTLCRSSWDLLDEAANLCSGTIDEILDSVVQGFLATDDGRALARAESLGKLKKVFGENRG